APVEQCVLHQVGGRCVVRDGWVASVDDLREGVVLRDLDGVTGDGGRTAWRIPIEIGAQGERLEAVVRRDKRRCIHHRAEVPHHRPVRDFVIVIDCPHTPVELGVVRQWVDGLELDGHLTGDEFFYHERGEGGGVIHLHVVVQEVRPCGQGDCLPYEQRREILVQRVVGRRDQNRNPGRICSRECANLRPSAGTV